MHRRATPKRSAPAPHLQHHAQQARRTPLPAKPLPYLQHHAQQPRRLLRGRRQLGRRRGGARHVRHGVAAPVRRRQRRRVCAPARTRRTHTRFRPRLLCARAVWDNSATTASRWGAAATAVIQRLCVWAGGTPGHVSDCAAVAARAQGVSGSPGDGAPHAAEADALRHGLDRRLDGRLAPRVQRHLRAPRHTGTGSANRTRMRGAVPLRARREDGLREVLPSRSAAGAQRGC